VSRTGSCEYKKSNCKGLQLPLRQAPWPMADVLVCQACYCLLTEKMLVSREPKSIVGKSARLYLKLVRTLIMSLFVVVPVALLIVGIKEQNPLSVAIGTFCLFLESIFLASFLKNR
jgi:hypothetical protein